jgi:hypothetical protein
MVTIHAHFDGRVLVPEGPVDLPRGRLLELQVSELEETATNDSTRVIGERNGLPFVQVPPDAKKFTSEDVRRDEDEL